MLEEKEKEIDRLKAMEKKREEEEKRLHAFL
jgi:hypothetical protein